MIVLQIIIDISYSLTAINSVTHTLFIMVNVDNRIDISRDFSLSYVYIRTIIRIMSYIGVLTVILAHLDCTVSAHVTSTSLTDAVIQKFTLC